jgi:hypothetical protein
MLSPCVCLLACLYPCLSVFLLGRPACLHACLPAMHVVVVLVQLFVLSIK